MAEWNSSIAGNSAPRIGRWITRAPTVTWPRPYAASPRIHARSTEEPNDLDDGDEYNRPWLYGVEVGHWQLTDAQAAAMREYLLRGGFFMCDDFHGPVEWSFFEASMRKVFPDRPIVEIENSDPIFPHHL
ncbi:MAG: DUF4159 domain-containing protein [Ignavibacteriota bacterium]